MHKSSGKESGDFIPQASKLYSQAAAPKKPSVLALDPHIYDPSTKSSISSETYQSAVEEAYSPEKTLRGEDDASNKNSPAASDDDDSSSGSTTSGSYLSDGKSSSEEGSFVSAELNVSPRSRNKEDHGTILPEDVAVTVKVLQTLERTMKESSRHHQKKHLELNENLNKLQKAVIDNVSVLGDFIVDFGLKSADNLEQVIEEINPRMEAMEEIAKLSAELDALEEYLDLSTPQIQRDLDTIQRATENLKKQRELEGSIKSYEAQSLQRRAMFNALESDDARLIRQTAHHVSEPKTRYGVAEIQHRVPMILVGLTDLEKNLYSMKKSYPGGEVEEKLEEFILSMQGLIQRVKSEMSKQLIIGLPPALSPATSVMPSGASTNSGTPLTNLDSFTPTKTANSTAANTPSTSFNSGSTATSHIVAPTPTAAYDSKVSDSMATASDSKMSTASSALASEATQSSSTATANAATEETQSSSSELDVTQSSVNSFLEAAVLSSAELQLEPTQSSPSLKTAISLSNVLSAESQHSTDSSSTVAI